VSRVYKDGTPFRFVPCKVCKNFEDGCEYCRQFKCPLCDKWRPWDYGCDDEFVAVCDDCWGKLTKMGFKPEDRAERHEKT
jgi:hypothetical protein